MKLAKLFKKVEDFFKIDSSTVDEQKKEDLINALDKKIASTKEKIKNSSSKSKTLKLKKKLNILKELEAKLQS